jgi:uncharacterized repeat protein (TIGR01451 family)
MIAFNIVMDWMRMKGTHPYACHKNSGKATRMKGDHVMGNLVKGSKSLALILVFIFCSANPATSTTNVHFAAGAYIIDMGSFPYTYATGLKPYGLVYDLVINKHIPVSWAINSSKSKDGVDFTVGAKNYRGGPLIIPAEYASLALSTINTWKAKGVLVDGPTTSFTAPIYGNITSFPNAVCDLQNGAIIVSDFYTKAEVPSTSYRLGSPQDLGPCDDIYAMPHADPQKWTLLQKTTFYNFINGGGYLWAACHAVSAMEAPTPTYLGYYFLSTNGLIPWGSHSDPTPPYSYNVSSAKDPVMQFLGRLDNALQSGSEQVYLPRLGSSWRPSATVAVWDPDQVDVVAGRSPGPAAIVAYGYAYGNSSKGFIVYEASHSLATGNVSENVDAARVYGNTLLLAGIGKRPEIAMSVPQFMVSGQTVTLSGAVSGGTPPYTYKWSSTCGGLFSNPNSATTSFTAPSTGVTLSCIIQLTITDQCNRKNFASQTVTIYPTIMTLNKTDFKVVVSTGEILNYSIYYRNLNPSLDATNVEVVDLLPAQLTYIPNASPVPSGNVLNPNGTRTLTWSLGTVPKNSGYRIIRLNASVKDSVSPGSTITDRVSLSYKVNSSGPYLLQAQDIDLLAPLNKRVNLTQAMVGNRLRYTICPNYNGTSLLTNAIIRDTIPPNTIYVTGSVNASGTWFSLNKTLLWRLGSNAAGVPGKVTGLGALKYNRTVAVNDTYLRKDAATTNYGAKIDMEIEGTTNNARRAILYFQPTLPVGAVIDKAFLDVYVTDGKPATVNVYRMNRSWCLHSNSVCNSCAAGIVEGTATGGGAVPTNFYGATWNYYDYNTAPDPDLTCSWSRAERGGDYVETPSYGSFTVLNGVTGRFLQANQANLTPLVKMWYSGTENQGIILITTAQNERPKIGSRDNTDTPDKKPYLNVTYYMPSGTSTNVTISAKPLLSCGGTALVIMTVNASAKINITAPASLTTTVTGGVTAFKTSGPTPASYKDVPAGTSVTFRYLYSLTPGTNPGTIKFTGKPTSNTTGATFADATSETLLVTPRVGYAVTIDPATPPSVTSINNTANMSDSHVFTSPIDSNLVTTTLYTASASINVNKTVNLSQGPPCTYVNFTLNVSNTGDATLNPVQVVDTLPSGLTYISSHPSGSPNMNQVTWTNIGPLAKGAYKKLYIVAHIDGSVFGNLINMVNTTGTTPDGRTVRHNDTRVVKALTAGMNVFKSGNETVRIPCQYVNFTLKVVNTGETTLNPVVLTDIYQDGLEYVSSHPTATYVDPVNNQIVWSNRGPLNGGQNSLTYVVFHISDAYYGELENTVVAKGKLPTGLNLTAVNYTSVYVPEPKISVQKIAEPLDGIPGDNINFTIKVTNTGEINLSPVKVVDVLPAGLVYKADNRSGSVSGNTITWADVGLLMPGASTYILLQATIDGSVLDYLTNLVSATGWTPTGYYVESQATAIVRAHGKPDISITKNATPQDVGPNDIVTYLINVTNIGQTLLKTVRVVDVLPVMMTYVSDNRSGTVADGVITWENLGPLGVHNSTYIELKAKVVV